MKKTTLVKTMLLLCALVVGSSNLWADDPADWSYTVVNGDASKLNTTAKTFTVDANHVWSYEGTTVAAGTSPSITIGSYSQTYGIKFGESSSKYYSPVILSSSAFSGKAVTKVSLYLKHNGSKAGTLTVKQGSTTIGTATTSSTSDWITVTCSETKKGAGGTLEIKYEVAQAIYINKIEVWYDDLGTATTTTIDASGITNTDVYTSTAAGSLSASVTEKVGGAAVAGATVEWTSSDENVATVATDGTVTLKKSGSTTITASYAGNATYAGSSADYVLNVTSSAPQETDIDATFNNVFLGVDAGSRISKKTTVTVKNVDFVFDKPSGSNWPQGDAGLIRMYNGTTLQIIAPAGYAITDITFTANGDWKDGMTASTGTYNDTKDEDNKTYWSGSVSSVTFSPGGTHRIASVAVTLSNQATITLAAACTDGNKYYGTYSAPYAFIVPSGLTVSEISVISGELYVENYDEGDVVPANTGVMISSDTSGDHTITLAAGGTSVLGSDNMLKPSGDAGITAANMTVANTKFYRLTMHDGTKIGFWWGAAYGAAFDLAANKAYLAIPNTAMESRAGLWFGDENVTAISDALRLNDKGEMRNDSYFNLAGQRVAQPTKGLYIVNGKKVIIK